MDKISPEARSRVMRAIRSKDTGPELLVRRAARRLGLRFAANNGTLPGSPDLAVYGDWRLSEPTVRQRVACSCTAASGTGTAAAGAGCPTRTARFGPKSSAATGRGTCASFASSGRRAGASW